MSVPADRAPHILTHLEASGITLIEWETSLTVRLGCPNMPNGSRFFLVPDDQLPKLQSAIADLGFSPADATILPPLYPSELLGPTIRYHILSATDGLAGIPRRRLTFIPLSYTGITLDETIPITKDDELWPPLPPSTLTVPLPAACAALTRIAARRESLDHLRLMLLEQVSGIVTYTFFDMSYEGDYHDIPPDSVPLSDAEVREIEEAVAAVKGWKLREEEQWVKDTLVDIFRGKKMYMDFPYAKAERSKGVKP